MADKQAKKAEAEKAVKETKGAAEEENVTMAKLLVEVGGADITITNNDHVTALQIAQENESRDMYNYLSSVIPNPPPMPL